MPIIVLILQHVQYVYHEYLVFTLSHITKLQNRHTVMNFKRLEDDFYFILLNSLDTRHLYEYDLSQTLL